jgi:hypothetical protein
MSLTVKVAWAGGLVAMLLPLLVACSASDTPGSDAGGGGSGSSRPAAVDDMAAAQSESPHWRRERRVLPAYRASIRPIGHQLRARIQFSHQAGCPVPLADLRHLRLSYVGFGGQVRRGELVVHEDHARAVVRVFEAAYDARWPITRMRLVDAYRGDDDRSMAANNTSAYNCRRVTGTDHWSAHAYGTAVDINPVQNPFVRGNTVQPPAGRRFTELDRSRHARIPPGVIRDDGVLVRAFHRIGWKWGGAWPGSPDYQHFYAPTRP